MLNTLTVLYDPSDLSGELFIAIILGIALISVLVFQYILIARKRYEEQRLTELVNTRTKALEEATVAAKNASLAKTSFLAGMSHEIRTPMNAIIGMLELLSREELNSNQHKYVDDIIHSANSLLTIINDILDMSKIESGKLELIPVDYDFLALIDNVHSMFTYLSEEKGLEFRLETVGEIPQFLYGDDIRLRQIIVNICGNAVKFTEKGYVCLRLTREADNLIFEVKDTGRGIKEEDIDYLFSVFEQADLVKNRHISGTGLGLAISRSFSLMMNGSIAVESEYGKGSTFTVTIPLILGNGNNIAKSQAVKGKKFYAPKANILIVDDNEFNLKVAVGLMGLWKIEAKTASSGAEAIRMVQESDYDIVFMDHMMPEMDGVEATAAIRALGGKYKDLNILALTANAVQGAREFFLANGLNDFISKPIDVREMIHLLEKWLPKELQESVHEESEEPIDDKSDFIEALSEIKQINTDVGLNGFSGNVNLYYESVQMCCNMLPVESEQMNSQLTKGDISGFAIKVHAIKSVLATIGAVELSKTALMLETAAKSGESDTCLTHFPDFRTSLLSLHELLLSVLPEEEKINKTPGDPAFLRECIIKSVAAAKDFDNDEGIAAIEALLFFDYGDGINALLESALSDFKNFDCDKAADTLNQIYHP